MAAGRRRVEAGIAPLPPRLGPSSGGKGRFPRLLRAFLAAAPRRDPALVERLAATARGRLGAGWELRRCAVLMLEHLFWASETPSEEALILSHLGPDGLDESAIDAAGLRRRIARNARVHAGLRGSATSPEALADFLHLAAQDSRLTLMRWFFTPGEVVARIAGRLRSSRAVIQPLLRLPEIAAEAARALAGLPEWERQIARALACAPCAFWEPQGGGLALSGDLGDLVESPAGTVVHTVKPPGSDLEIEIKRTGRPNPRPLAVVWERDGQPVPSSHRLDGGSTWDLLRWEAAAAARLSAVWRALHGEAAPVARALAVKAVYALPDGDGELPVLDFFTQEDASGPGARENPLAQVVAAYCAEENGEMPDPPEAIALAARFLLYAAPAQSVLLGTSAHRLDKLAASLGAAGSRPGLPGDAEAARRTLADLLDEVLGVFQPPAGGWSDPAAWLDAVFALPANRRRADACHRAAAERLGALWGTFLAVGGRSHGESLVGRNVGLKAVFRDGEWRVELISMDHDSLLVPGREREGESEELNPAMLLAGNVKDELALFGGPYKGAQVRGSLELLDDIYRAGEERREAARGRFFAAAREAFERSVAALEPGGAAAGLFAPACLAELGRWRRAVGEFLAQGGAALAAYPAWAEAIERHADFLRRQAAVYTGLPGRRRGVRVSYGHPDLAGPAGHAEGGLVKLQALLPWWPNTAAGYDVLYVVSSRLPARIQELYEEARAAGARVVLNQAAPACRATHGERFQELNRPLDFLLPRADFVFYQSAFGRRMCDAILGPRQGPAALLPNAVDTDRFVPAAADPAPGELRVLLGGTQYREYRLRRALEAFARVARARPEARLWVTGRLKWLPDLAEARRRAEAWCGELGIADRVEFLGPYSQERAPEIFQRAHVLLHTMALDCCPTAVIEAMACGLPVVYGAGGGVPELVGADAGVGVPLAEDFEMLQLPEPDALAEAVLLAAECRRKLGEAGRQRAVELFDRRAWISRHRELFAQWDAD